jgi:hypothetical protein
MELFFGDPEEVGKGNPGAVAPEVADPELGEAVPILFSMVAGSTAVNEVSRQRDDKDDTKQISVVTVAESKAALGDDNDVGLQDGDNADRRASTASIMSSDRQQVDWTCFMQNPQNDIMIDANAIFNMNADDESLSSDEHKSEENSDVKRGRGDGSDDSDDIDLDDMFVLKMLPLVFADSEGGDISALLSERNRESKESPRVAGGGDSGGGWASFLMDDKAAQRKDVMELFTKGDDELFNDDSDSAS